MGEAKRRKEKDPNYGKPKSYMSYLELPHTKVLVTHRELKEMIGYLKKWTSTHQFYATVIKDHTGRWEKIEKLCYFIGMQKLLNHNNQLYNTSSVFITEKFEDDDKNRLISYYRAENMNGFSVPAADENIAKDTVKKVLENCQKVYEELVKAQDVKIIYKSENCSAFHIPALETNLEGLCYVEFFTKLEF